MSHSAIETPPRSEPLTPDTTPSWTALDRMAANWGQSDALALAQFFAESCEGNCPLAELVRILQTRLERLGFRHFACCSHVDPLHTPQGAVMFHNYPDAWARTFSELTLYVEDPVLLHAERCALPFYWDDPTFLTGVTKDQKIILLEGASLGLARGYTIPIHSSLESGAIRASCSIVPDSKSIDPGSYIVVENMAHRLYHTANRQLRKQEERVELTNRECECLELAARGKTDKEIGLILNLSPHTVHTYIERSKERMDVTKRMQAVVLAVEARQISYSGTIRSKRPPLSEHHRSAGAHSRAPEIHDVLLSELRQTRLPAP